MFAYGEFEIVEATADSIISASTWAQEGITSALVKGFVPANLWCNYQDAITREEFCRMAVVS